MALRNYIDSLSTQQQMPRPRLAVQHGHNASHVYAFICIPFNDRRDMAAQCRVKPTPTLPAAVQSSTVCGLVFQNLKLQAILVTQKKP